MPIDHARPDQQDEEDHQVAVAEHGKRAASEERDRAQHDGRGNGSGHDFGSPSVRRNSASTRISTKPTMTASTTSERGMPSAGDGSVSSSLKNVTLAGSSSSTKIAVTTEPIVSSSARRCGEERRRTTSAGCARRGGTRRPPQHREPQQQNRGELVRPIQAAYA